MADQPAKRPPAQHLSTERGPHHHKSYHLHHHDISDGIGRQRGSVATARNARERKERLLHRNHEPESQHDDDIELGKHIPSAGPPHLPASDLPNRPPVPSRRHRLSIRANPFSVRSGKKLAWTNVTMELVNGNDDGQKRCPCIANSKDVKDTPQERKLILDDCWGEVPEKEITAIIGPSGSGKTSLLNVLAGRAKTRGKLRVSADVRLNNYNVDPTKQGVRKQIAFVPQDDSLQITATPREAIRFSAKMRLSAKTSEEELDNLTTVMLSELGLKDCADTIIGGALVKGISGGERKRTAVGVELVTKPALIFLDGKSRSLTVF